MVSHIVPRAPAAYTCVRMGASMCPGASVGSARSFGGDAAADASSAKQVLLSRLMEAVSRQSGADAILQESSVQFLSSRVSCFAWVVRLCAARVEVCAD